MELKRLLSLWLVCAATIARAANPTFQSFDPNQFNANAAANTVQIKGFVTNYNFAMFGLTNKADWVTRCFITNGANVLTTTNGHFTAADIGKKISIWFAGGNNHNHFTTITTVVNPTNITVADNAGQTTTNFVGSAGMGTSACYGLDNTVATSNMLYTVGNQGGGRVLCSAGTYMWNGPVADIGIGTNHHNSIVWLPEIAHTNGSAEVVIELDGNPSEQWNGNNLEYDIIPPVNATIFVPAGLTNSPNPTQITYKIQTMGQSALDTRNMTSPYWISGTGNNIWGNTNGVQFPMNAVKLVLDNIMFIVPYDNNAACVNAIGCDKFEFRDVTATTGVQLNVQPLITGTNGYGIILPANFGNAKSEGRGLSSIGFYNGIDLGALQGDYIWVFGCVKAYTTHFSGSIQTDTHAMWSIACATNFDTFNTGGGSIKANLWVQNFQSTNWYATNQVLFNDAANVWQGDVWLNWNNGNNLPTFGNFHALGLNIINSMFNSPEEYFDPVNFKTNINVGGSLVVTNTFTRTGGGTATWKLQNLAPQIVSDSPGGNQFMWDWTILGFDAYRMISDFTASAAPSPYVWRIQNAQSGAYIIELSTNNTTYINRLALSTNTSVAFNLNVGTFWASNYDLYWVTPTKTNLIILGH